MRERPKTEAETAEELQKAEDGMELLFLGENQDLEHITEKVNMPSVYPGTDIAIQWYLNSWEYISVDGTVKNEGFTRAEQVESDSSSVTGGSDGLMGQNSMGLSAGKSG